MNEMSDVVGFHNPILVNSTIPGREMLLTVVSLDCLLPSDPFVRLVVF